MFKPPKAPGACLKGLKISGHGPRNLSFDLSSKLSGRCPHQLDWTR